LTKITGTPAHTRPDGEHVEDVPPAFAAFLVAAIAFM
jgi:hypothetical protein